ncbi:unnamed protein product [Thlaspi arvense]|uniref:Uncharacterized protein n=1 Tax=Thlaspi arvense TaxID=13288 RepID=A0AAU9SVY3_THLAR|nr:unnamed protein product [Thlaspi arvense]
MTCSMVSSMLLFLLLLLVFPRIDKAFGAQMEVRKLMSTNSSKSYQPGQKTVGSRIPIRRPPGSSCGYYRRCKRTVPGLNSPPPPPPYGPAH